MPRLDQNLRRDSDYSDIFGHILNDNGAGPHNSIPADLNALFDARAKANVRAFANMHAASQTSARSYMCMTLNNAIVLDNRSRVDDYIVFDPRRGIDYGAGHHGGCVAYLCPAGDYRLRMHGTCTCKSCVQRLLVKSSTPARVSDGAQSYEKTARALAIELGQMRVIADHGDAT